MHQQQQQQHHPQNFTKIRETRAICREKERESHHLMGEKESKDLMFWLQKRGTDRQLNQQQYSKFN